jgi:hypothetical protein
MKKISLISMFVVIAAVIIMAFNIQGTSNEKKSINDIHFIIQNCPDCTSMYYCINGGPRVYPGTCEFFLTVPPDPPIIYLMCVTCGTRTGQAKYDYSYGKVIITVAEGGTSCNCSGDGNKKK